MTPPTNEADLRLAHRSQPEAYAQKIAEVRTTLDDLRGLVESAATHGDPALVAIFEKVKTAQKKVRLAESDRKTQDEDLLLRLALEAARMGTWAWDVAANRLDFSSEIGPLLGLPEGTVLPTFQSFLELVHPEDREAVGRSMSDSLQQLENEYSVDYRVIWPDGSVHWMSSLGRVLHDETGHPIRLVGVVWDVHARKAAEERSHQHQLELAHVARVSTMGEMASGLAHELNQPLAAVVNYAQGALRRLRAGSGAREDVLMAIESASNQAQRAAEIIRRLSNFVHKGETQRDLCNLNDVVLEVAGFAADDARHHGSVIRLDLAHDLPPVLVDNIQIQQVILNLVRNAVEAMSEIESGERVVKIHTSSDPDAVCVAVDDHGPGLTAEANERIFAPFYTTKPRGMGMGLSISRSIIDAHGGKLWATPKPGGGTTFQFTLPLANGALTDEHRSSRVRR